MASSMVADASRPVGPNFPDGVAPVLERAAYELGRSEEVLNEVPGAVWDQREAASEARLAGESLTLAQLLEDLALPERSGADRSSAARGWLHALRLARDPSPGLSALTVPHWHAVSSCLVPKDADSEPLKGDLGREGEALRVLLATHGGLAAASSVSRVCPTASPCKRAARLARLASHALLHHSGLSTRGVAPLAAIASSSSHADSGSLEEETAGMSDRPCVVWLTALQRALAERRSLVRALVELAERDARRVAELPRCASYTLAVLAQLRKTPVATLTSVSQETRICFPTTLRAMQRLLDCGIVREVTGRRSKRAFAYESYVQLLEPGNAARSAVSTSADGG